MIFNFVRSTTFLTFRAMSSASKCKVTLLPMVATLRYARVYVSPSNSSNIMTKIEEVVNKKLSLETIL